MIRSVNRLARRAAVFLSFSITLAVPAFGQSDVDGAADHPGIPRYDGSWILGYETKSFASFDLPTGPAVKKDGTWQGDTNETVEGAFTRLLYVAPEGRSTLEVFRNYETALSERGFDILFSCSGKACGNNLAMGRNILWTNELRLATAGDITSYALTGMKDDHYLAARSADGVTSLALYVAQNDFNRFPETFGRAIVLMNVIDSAAMEHNMIDAEGMAKSISETGRVTVDNIYFDFNEATLKPESADALSEMARLLSEYADVNVYVVGHTDNVGSMEFNLDLSRRRAEAVVTALVERYGVDATRIVPAGVGSLAPVASNATTDGQAKNRRVELVQR